MNQYQKSQIKAMNTLSQDHLKVGLSITFISLFLLTIIFYIKKMYFSVMFKILQLLIDLNFMRFIFLNNMLMKSS